MMSKSLRMAFLPTPYIFIICDVVSFFPDSSIRLCHAAAGMHCPSCFTSFRCLIPCGYYRKSNVPPMATFLKKSDNFFKNGKSYTDFFLKESLICQCCQKSRYNVIASTACVPSQADFFQFSKGRKLEKNACRGKFPPSPLCTQKSMKCPDGISDFFTHFSARISPITG